jgi:hypothetical protein
MEPERMCESGKVEYTSRNQAHVAIKKFGFRNMRLYECGSHWHFTRAGEKNIKHQKLSKGAGPKPYIPSAAKLRRKIREAGLQIAAQRRRIEKADRILAEKTAKANASKKQAEADYKLEMEAIEIMVGRLTRI